MKIRATVQFSVVALIGISVGLSLLAWGMEPNAKGHMTLRSPVLAIVSSVFLVVGFASSLVALARALAAAMEKLSRGKRRDS